MKQPYFIVLLTHSLHGRLRRIQISHTVLYAVLGLVVVGWFSVFGFISSYVRMTWKVANYNALKKEAEGLRARYENLQRIVNQTNEQLATLELFANEVSVAYGIQRKLEGPAGIAAEGRLVPTFAESLAEYNFLKSSNFSRFERSHARIWNKKNFQPSLWPVEGRLIGSFGERIDPFSGEGAYHTGVDISAPTGTVVRFTGDGIVSFADWASGYGRLVILDHGSGVQTYYAHLSHFAVNSGQEVRRGEAVGTVGSSGRVTAPHLHYEVRVGGTPMNPHRYLSKAPVLQASRMDIPF